MMNGGGGGGVRTDGGEGVVLLGHHRQWVQDHCQPYALAIYQGGGCARWLFDLWAVVVAHGCGALFVDAELLSMGTGLLIVGGGACLCRWVVHDCWFVVCGHSGDMSSAVWSPLARLDGKRVGLTINNSMNINGHLLFGCHVTLGDVAPANAPTLLVLL